MLVLVERSTLHVEEEARPVCLKILPLFGFAFQKPTYKEVKVRGGASDIQRVTKCPPLPYTVFSLVCKRVTIFSWSPSREKTGEMGEEEEEKIAKQSYHVLKP